MRKAHANLSRQRALRLRKKRRELRLKALEVLPRLQELQAKYGRLPRQRVLRAGLRHRCQATIALARAAGA